MPKLLVPVIFFFSLLFLGTPKIYAAISFSISNPQTDGEIVTFDVSISGLTSSRCTDGYCYLQAAFTKPNQPRYFGFTQNQNGQWYQYDGSPGKDNIKSTFFSFQPQGGNWLGNLTIKVDSEDPDYDGPGTYNIKAWRYSGKSDNYSGDSDNTLSVQLTSSAPNPTPTSQSTTAKSTSSTSSKSKSPGSSPKNSPSPASSKKTTSVLGSSQSAEITASQAAGISLSVSPTPSAEPKADKSSNKIKIAGAVAGSGAIVMGLSAGLYLWYRRSLRSAQSKDDADLKKRLVTHGDNKEQA